MIQRSAHKQKSKNAPFGTSPFFDSVERQVSLPGFRSNHLQGSAVFGPALCFFSQFLIPRDVFVHGLVIVSPSLPQISVAVISSKWMSLLPLRTSQSSVSLLSSSTLSSLITRSRSRFRRYIRMQFCCSCFWQRMTWMRWRVGVGG